MGLAYKIFLQSLENLILLLFEEYIVGMEYVVKLRSFREDNKHSIYRNKIL